MKKRLLSVALAVVMAVCLMLLACVFNLKRENSNLKTDGIELNRCYLCGGKVEIYPVNDSFYIKCEDCDLQTDYFDSKSDLIRYWNKD